MWGGHFTLTTQLPCGLCSTSKVSSQWLLSVDWARGGLPAGFLEFHRDNEISGRGGQATVSSHQRQGWHGFRGEHRGEETGVVFAAWPRVSRGITAAIVSVGFSREAEPIRNRLK